MATTAIRDLQLALLPAAIGSFATIYSNVQAMMIMGKIRYADKEAKVHPYKPWTDKGDKADAHFRAFKACQNGTEWTVYSVPITILLGLYSPTIPVVGQHLYWAPALLGCGFAYFNGEYVQGYIKSADDRIPGFKGRTLCFRGLAYLLIASLGCALAQKYNLL
jgi:hypothetical protein